MLAAAALSTALSLAASPFSLLAIQDPVAPAPDRSVFRIEGEEIVLGVQEGPKALTLLDLAREVGELEKISFYLPERGDEDALRKEQVRLLRELRVPKLQARELLENLLKQHNFAMVEQGEAPLRTVRLVRMQGEGLQALKSSLRFVPPAELEGYRNRSGSLVVTTLSLQHLNPQAATTMLSRFFSNAALEGFASINDGTSSPALMIVGFGPTLCAIRDLIQSLDVPARGDSGVEELHFGIELWEIEDASLGSALAELSKPEEIAERLRASGRKQGPFSVRASLITGKPMSVPIPAAPSASDAANRTGQLEITAQRQDAERFQVSVKWQGATSTSKAEEAHAANALHISSAMLMKPGELRVVTMAPDASRTLVVLLRLRG
ncbi:MAG: hypothetical protein IPN34_20475 [Planctomycetes bacterium]|nr:hypothetical protein [Planctomycetota bacterium]